MTIDTLTVADDPAAWRAAGFDVDEAGRCQIGTVLVQLVPEGRGIASWSLRGLSEGSDPSELDGLPTEPSDAPERASAPAHPNGVRTIDHLVAFTPDRARTAAALEAAGLDLRRMRDEPTPAGGGYQAFFRLGEVILEVIEQKEVDRPRFWGLALGVESFDAAAELLGDRLSEPRDAVQPGRKIATLRRSAGVAIPMALMTPGPGAA